MAESVMYWARHLRKFTLRLIPQHQASTQGVKYKRLDMSISKGYSRKSCILFILGIIALFLTYVGTAGFVGWAMYQNRLGGLIYSPARHAVSHERRIIDQSIRTPFHYGPSLATDAAWRDLLKYNNIALSEHDLERLNRSSVSLKGREGYLGGLDVFHELHCLNFVRENIYSDYYAMPSKEYRDEHLFHCIDHLREIIMCHGNVAVHTFEWLDEYTSPFMKRQTQHVCRKWNPLQEWAEANSPDRKDGGPILEHPLLGVIKPKPANLTQAWIFEKQLYYWL